MELAGQRIGTIALHHLDEKRAALRWNFADDPDGHRIPMRSIKLVVDHAINVLGLQRVEATIDRSDTDTIRAASISGMRREGVIRGNLDETDRVLVARLAADPEPRSREGFIAILNAGLPTKRVISQGILTDERGRVLLCELTYKHEWDLPGGVIELDESPSIGLVREVREELGIDVEVLGLHTVNWLPAWRGWDDACVFVFNLGIVDSTIVEGMTLQPTEIRDVHWCEPADVTANATSAAQELLGALAKGPLPPYREAPLSP
ncbi:MAG: hypothetical protein JWP10_371 [Nocardioidaceae bacterium]|nr:hypothetical protein [Nocardioidaceae bacterium]